MGRKIDSLAFLQRLGERCDRADFFGVLRTLDALHPHKPKLGTAAAPEDDILRLGQEPTLAFEGSAIARVVQDADAALYRMDVNCFGLLGPNGALPLHVTQHAKNRASLGDVWLTRFLDLLQHRFMALFYRAWAQAEPVVGLDRPGDDRFARYLGALIGHAGTAPLAGSVHRYSPLFYAGLLARGQRNAEGLEELLADYFTVPLTEEGAKPERLPVHVEQFVGHWLSVPKPERTRLGTEPGAALGLGATLGSRVWDRQYKFRVRVGPMKLAQYERFLPEGDALDPLANLVRLYGSAELTWDLQLVLAAGEVPEARLGQRGRLGWTTWLRRPAAAGDADDLRLSEARLAARGRQQSHSSVRAAPRLH